MMVFILRCECRKEMFCMENTRNKKTKAQKKGLTTGLLLLTVFSLAGCYSPEEKALEKKYKKQAKVNAVNYIQDKYGFSATVKSASVQPGGNDFGIVDPHPTRLVFVTMEYEGDEFVVRIVGDEETTDGSDNYQREEILSALKSELDTLTGVDAEEVFAVYGEESEYKMERNSRNGLVAPYFNGENLKEILTSSHLNTNVAVTYINQEIEGFDVDKIKEQTGVNQFLFVDYDSKAHYDAIMNSKEKSIWDTKQNLPYINEYLNVEYKETEYVNCEKKTVDGILFVTEYPEETVTVEKQSGFSDGFVKKNAKLVFDVYMLDTESDIVHVFVPVEALSGMGRKTTGFVVQEDGKEDYRGSARLTSDGKYAGTTIYMRDHEGAIEFSVYVMED